VTLHAVIGEGSINKRELTHQLGDLWEKANKAEDQFWFLVEGKAEATQFDKDLMAFCVENGLFLATLTAEGTELDELYQQADAVMDAGFHVYGLNDSMEEITLEAPEAAEPEPPKAAKKAPAKKAAAQPKEVEAKEEEPADDERGPYDRAELEGMADAELKALANGMGVTGRGRKAYVDGILKLQGDTPVSDAVVTPLHNGHAVGNAALLAEDWVLIVIHGADGRVQFKAASAAAVAAL